MRVERRIREIEERASKLEEELRRLKVEEVGLKRLKELREEGKIMPDCPYCFNNSDIIKESRDAKGRQRYYCKRCRAYFVDRRGEELPEREFEHLASSLSVELKFGWRWAKRICGTELNATSSRSLTYFLVRKRWLMQRS